MWIMSSEPLSVEYAKSSKSGCKFCKKNIAKGELRVGFIGKANFGATAWYHYCCIWEDYENLKSIDCTKPVKSLIQGFSEIKDEDKKKLETDLPKYCAVAVKKADEPAPPKLPMAAEYAKSAKSSCKKCSKTIDKDTLRIGFTGKANFGATAWYHYNCVWNDYDNLRSIDTSKPIKQLVECYNDLRQEDKTRLDKDLPKSVKTAKENTDKESPIETDYAKSEKSTCKGCAKNISKGALRIGLTGKANFGATAWYHPDCLTALPKEKFSGINASESIQSIVDGLTLLKKGDQEKVEKTIKNICEGGNRKAKHGLQTEGSEESSPVKKRK